MEKISDHLKDQVFRDGNKRWKVARLFFLSQDLEPFDIPMKHLNIYSLHPSITTTKEFVEHIRYVLDADLSRPIILDEEGFVMDGRHRIVKALLEKRDCISAVRFEETPAPCFYKDET